jgi:hypothetical protein
MARRISLPSNPKVRGVSRMGDNPKALLVCFDREPSDDDIRALHEALKPPLPQPFSFRPIDPWWCS